MTGLIQCKKAKKGIISPAVGGLIQVRLVSLYPFGEMPEWPNGAVSKTAILARVSRVRISLSPLP